MRPLVSVIMSVHNEQEDHLLLAAESICRQTYDNMEFIIIDDASDEKCRSVLRSLSDRWNIIKLFHNKENIGLTASLNKALSEARGEYVARMDADDFSSPDRIEVQVNYMESHPEVDICGTGVISFGDSRMYMSPHNGLDDKAAKCLLFYSSTLCHPSVMMRKSFLDTNGLKYDETVLKGQDYDMWERCSQYGRLAVLKDVLLYYRVHKSQISVKNKGEQTYNADKVRVRRLERLGLSPSERDMKCHKALISCDDSDLTVEEVARWIEMLLEANKSACLVDMDVFSKDLNMRFVLFCIRRRQLGSLLNSRYWIPLVSLVWNRMSIQAGLYVEKRRMPKCLVYGKD